MVKQYVTTPSENFAERENQVSNYHPDLCFKFGQTHVAYGWSPIPRGDWDEEQKAAYLRAWNREDTTKKLAETDYAEIEERYLAHYAEDLKKRIPEK